MLIGAAGPLAARLPEAAPPVFRRSGASWVGGAAATATGAFFSLGSEAHPTTKSTTAAISR